MIFSRLIWTFALVLAFQLSMPSVVVADEVDEVLHWNTIAVSAIQPPAFPGALQQRAMAIVHVSIFDAVNGIDRRYEPIHVDSAGPQRASQRAAVVEAAYTALVTMFPPASPQVAILNSARTESLAAIALTDSVERIQRGRDWGHQVALAILAWRAADKTQQPVPPYVGCQPCGPEDAGKWRPTPPGFAAGLAPLLGSSQPFVIPSASSFRPKGPPDLKSPEYARDFNEVKRVGALNSISRTADQTASALFWAGAASSAWNRAAASASLRRHLKLSENARLFALLNMATADAIFTVWDSKYYFEFWRPIDAIRLADTDSNPATIADPAWVPLIVTPPYPEYYSGHQSVSGAAQEVLTSFFGNRMGFETFSEGPGTAPRSWRSFSDAADEAYMARIWSGIHFEFSMRDARKVSEKIAQYVLKHAAQPVHDRGDDDGDHD